MNIQKTIIFLLVIFSNIVVTPVFAVSFTADAIQIRGDITKRAKVFWQDGRVRFDYLDDGVSIAQIFDTYKRKVIWLDNKNKRYLEKPMPDAEKIQAMIKTKKIYDPCKQFKHASCVHLKQAIINGRKTDNWLITITNKNRDYHIFQWIDKKYKIILRQENADGSSLNVKLVDNQIIDGRKVRKLDMYAYSASGQEMHGVQWYDDELNIVIKQQYKDNYVDELKNIKVGKIKQAMFVVPKDYEHYEKTVQTAQQSEK